MFDCGRSFEAHLERDKSRCYYHFNRELAPAEIAEIESRVNQVIESDAAVEERFMSKEEAGRKFNLNRLPEGAGETVRIITIGDYDACPCIGAHVKRTKEIGVFRLYSTTYENNVLKIRFKLADG
jgi:Ser-tRNA(Ala) deacylase AlaX